MLVVEEEVAQSLADAVLDYKAEEVASPCFPSISTSAAHAPWGEGWWRSRSSTGPSAIRFDLVGALTNERPYKPHIKRLELWPVN